MGLRIFSYIMFCYYKSDSEKSNFDRQELTSLESLEVVWRSLDAAGERKETFPLIHDWLPQTITDTHLIIPPT